MFRERFLLKQKPIGNVDGTSAEMKVTCGELVETVVAIVDVAITSVIGVTGVDDVSAGCIIDEGERLFATTVTEAPQFVLLPLSTEFVGIMFFPDAFESLKST